MYQANADAYESPTDKCTDINLILHSHRCRETAVFLNKSASYFRVLPCTYTAFDRKGVSIITAFTCMLACDFNKLNVR